jgi:two-component system NtrC family sensor kinase
LERTIGCLLRLGGWMILMWCIWGTVNAQEIKPVYMDSTYKHDPYDLTIMSEVDSTDVYFSRVNQVFLNLLVNAAQAIEGKGQITIRTRKVGEMVEIDIVDNGRGISKENISRIFDPGFTTKGVGVGTGLGLSICYQIIEDHHGEIRVFSKLGEGTTFTVLLPIQMKMDE